MSMRDRLIAMEINEVDVVDCPLCYLGLTTEGFITVSWSKEQVDLLRKTWTPEELIQMTQAVEMAFSEFSAALFGGKQ